MSTRPANTEIADFLNRHGALMELNGDNPFRVRAMANAARMIEELGVDAAAMAADGTLTEVEGIGKGVEELVVEFAHTGSSQTHEALKRKIPEGLLDILRIPGLGTRKVRALYDGAGIESVEELETACREGRLDQLSGLGAKTRENILAAIGRLRKFGQSWLLHEAAIQAGELCEALRTLPGTTRAGIAGSLRRSKETVKDIDLVAGSDDPASVSAAFARHPMVREVIARGDTKTSVRLNSGIQADLRIVSDDRFPALLHHFTGSRDHNVAMRSRALGRGMRLNEYGLFTGSGERSPVAKRPSSTPPSAWTTSPLSCARVSAKSRQPPKERYPSSSAPETFAACCTCTPRTATAGTPSPGWPRPPAGGDIPISASATTVSQPGTCLASRRKKWPHSTWRSMK